MRIAAERVLPGAAINFRSWIAGYATLSTILPMPGGGGAFTTGWVAASRSLACCSGVAFGDVPVFGMMS
jgi:hypothetical protein